MTKPTPDGVKKICGLLFPEDDEDLLKTTTRELEAIFGSVERSSDRYEWRYTNYYDDISPRLARIFISFAGLADPEELASWKLAAVELENRYARSGVRIFNADPGYVDASRLVLASTKDAPQRVALRSGIRAEITMIRRKSGWQKFFYTFPDFSSGAYDAFFDAVRCDHRKDARAERMIRR